MRVSEIVLDVYKHLLQLRKNGVGIPVNLRPKSVVGTVQDDPFDCWVGEQLEIVLAPRFEVFHSGKLTTPDIVLREKATGQCIGLEIKKLIQQANGQDSRGLTLDYNSCLPCGQTFIKIGDDTVKIPCFYLFAMLDNSSRYIKTLILMDGDFLNYDVELHKESKVSNYTEYNHGPYGEGSVRHRSMYTYPNPLNSKISLFFEKFLLVCKSNDLFGIEEIDESYNIVVRKDIYQNKFKYSVVDLTAKSQIINPEVLEGIFDACKNRSPKPRTAVMPVLPPYKEEDV